VCGLPVKAVVRPHLSISEVECFDADIGNDLASEVREYFLPNFSHWQDREAFRTRFSRLLDDLKAS